MTRTGPRDPRVTPLWMSSNTAVFCRLKLESMNDTLRMTDAIDALHDAQSAYQWVVSQGDEFGVDESQVYVGGGSAGGHLAAAVAMIPNKSITQEPAGMLLFNPGVDIARSARIQGLFRNQAEQYSPIKFVRPSLPSAWIVHGTADKIVPHSTVVDFQGFAEFVKVAFRNHFGEHLGSLLAQFWPPLGSSGPSG